MKHSYENSIFRMLPNTENRFPDYFPLQNQTPGFQFPYGNSFSPAFILHSEFNLHRAKCSLSLSLKGVCIAMEDFVRVSTVCKRSNVIVRVYKYACAVDCVDGLGHTNTCKKNTRSYARDCWRRT